MVDISEENVLYLSYTKKIISNNHISIYTTMDLLLFCCSKYHVASTETSHDYSGHMYAFMNDFFLIF
jgi:hypothetical protein